jgi:hypothetical protein
VGRSRRGKPTRLAVAGIFEAALRPIEPPSAACFRNFVGDGINCLLISDHWQLANPYHRGGDEQTAMAIPCNVLVYSLPGGAACGRVVGSCNCTAES